MAKAWPYLVEEQQYPIQFEPRKEPAKLFQLLPKAKQRFDHSGSAMANQERKQLADFLIFHDFSAVLREKVPPVLLLRRGNQMLAAAEGNEFVLSFSETMTALENLGNVIAGRIAWLKDEPSCLAFKHWQMRDAMSNLQRFQLATKLDEALLRKILPFDIDSPVANDHLYGLKAAARMVGSRVPENELRQILLEVSQISQKGHLEAEQLRKLWGDAADCVAENRSLLPSDNGYLLAALVRKQLNCGANRIDPESLLRKWGVSVRDVDLLGSAVDAIAVWREKQSATILINKNGLRAKLATGRRSTLAHEICHILVDLDGALPAVEIFGGNAPKEIEQRANAFAAELLLPQCVAAKRVTEGLADMLTQDQRKNKIATIIRSLVEEYGASDEIVTWQILNSGAKLNDNDKAFLDRKKKSVHDPY